MQRLRRKQLLRDILDMRSHIQSHSQRITTRSSPIACGADRAIDPYSCQSFRPGVVWGDRVVRQRFQSHSLVGRSGYPFFGREKELGKGALLVGLYAVFLPVFTSSNSSFIISLVLDAQNRLILHTSTCTRHCSQVPLPLPSLVEASYEWGIKYALGSLHVKRS